MKPLREYMRHIWNRLYTHIPIEHREGFELELLEETYSRLSAVSIILILILTGLYFIEDKLFHTGPIILAFIIICAVLIPQIFYIDKHIRIVNRTYALAVMYAFALFTLLYAVAVVLYIQSQADLVHLYLMIVFGVSLFFNMKPIPNAILFSSVYLSFILLLPYYQADADTRLTISINTLVFNLLAWLQNRLTFRAKLSKYLNRKLLKEKNSRLEELAKKDAMTGLYNHAESFLRLKEEIDNAKHMDYPLSLIIIDIDDFKNLNDQYGHLVGDDTIKIISQAIVKTVKQTDIVGRYGGEEFIIIMPHTDIFAARELAVKIQSSIARAQVDTNVTISGGISQYDRETLNELIRKTDEKLYAAKRNGKNRFEAT